MSGLAIITEACIDTKDRACVDVCPVQCIYEYDPESNTLFSEMEAGVGVENTHQPDPDMIAIYTEENVPDGSPKAKYNSDDPHTGHDHTFFIGHSRAVFAD